MSRKSARVQPNFGYRVPTGSTEVNSSWAGALRGSTLPAQSTLKSTANTRGPPTIPASLKVLDVPLHFCHEDDLRLLVTEITRLRKENAELEQIKRENEELRAAFGQMSEDRLHEKASRQDKLKKAILEMRDGDDRTLLTMTFKEWVVLAREAKAAAELDKKEKAIKDLTDKREALKIQADEKQDRVKNKALMAFGSQFQKGGLRVTFHAWKTLTIAESSRRQMHGGISLAFARNSSKALKDLCFSAWKQLAYEEKLQKKAHEKMMATSAEQANLRMRLIAKTTAYWAKDAAVFHRAVLGAWHRYARERREHRRGPSSSGRAAAWPRDGWQMWTSRLSYDLLSKSGMPRCWS
jgi:hypothetical protein